MRVCIFVFHFIIVVCVFIGRKTYLWFSLLKQKPTLNCHVEEECFLNNFIEV